MSAQEIVEELKGLGNESSKKVLLKHGAREPFYGVKVEDLKKIQKRIKKDYELALELYDTGISDAMYLAGLIADDARMTKKDLQKWARGAYWYMLSEYTVPWVTAGSPHGWTLAREWIKSRKENIASSGWATFSTLVSITRDEKMDLAELEQLLERVQETIHQQPNRVRYTMNGYVIALATAVAPLTDKAFQTAEAIGPVAVDMGGTSCKVPLAREAILKVRQRGTIGKKRKSPKC